VRGRKAFGVWMEHLEERYIVWEEFVLLALEYGWNAVYFGSGQVNGKPDSIRHGC